MQYCLVVRVAGLEQLRQTMGDLATNMALQCLTTLLPGKIQAVLEHQSITPGVHQSQFAQGVCYSCFDYNRSDDLLSDPDFVQQILLAAETRLLAASVAVFGYATARLADLQIAMLPQAQSTDAGLVAQAFNQRYQQCVDLGDEAQQQLLALIDGAGPRIFLQQIVDIRRPGMPVIGYEALSRGPQGSKIERADQLFETARRCGLAEQLEKSCLQAAMPWLARIPQGQILSVNSSAGLLLEQEVQQLLARENLWIELTEHLPLGQARRLLPVLADLAGQGASIALDDTGCGYADLQAARELRPAVVKLCITVIRALAQSDAVVQELQTTISQLHELGCMVLAEGVETQGQLELMRELNVDYVQGWYFGRPAPAQEVLG